MIYATGKTGTVGRKLDDEVVGISANLKDLLLPNKLPRFGEFDALIHLAGVVGSEQVDSNLDLSHKVNVSGTIRVAEAFLAGCSGKFVFISTSHVYGPSSYILSEEAKISPLNNYAAQKFEAETLLLKMFRNEPSRLCIVRVFSVLDWDVKPFTLGGGIRKLTDSDSGYVLRFCDDVRDFLTPSTIAKVVKEIALHPSLSGIVNLCSGSGITIRQAAEEMLGAVGFQLPVHRIASGTSDIPHIVGNNSKLTEAFPGLDLRWKPSI